MQPTNQPKKQKSRCVFCGSVDYGKGCRFGPHKVHFHPDDSTKCSYCGSSDYGKGCKLNPTNNLHVHGGVYNNMYKEYVQSFLDNSILINELKKNFTDFQCYALGIIDENGNKLKNPVTEQEQIAYSSFTKTVIKLKKYLGAKVELMEASNSLEKLSVPINENIEHYRKILEYQSKIDGIVNELYKTIDQAQQEGIPLEDVKKLIKA
jgi:hypothetical protein